MSNEPKNTALPKLRFPEFQGENSWRESKLGEVSEIVRGGSPRPIEDFITTDTDGLNWLKIGDVAPEAKYIFKTQQKVIREALSKTREVSPGDLILSNSMSFGRPYIMKTKSCIHDGWIAIRRIADDVLTDYLYYAISSESSQIYFVANAAGAAVLNLNAERIKVLPLAIPSIEEQQKIAATLSSLDDLLTAQIAKLTALQAHKRGLIHSLFPAEGETVPKLRFPEFQNVRGWKEKTLGEIATFASGGTPSKDKPDYWNGDTPWISASSMHNYVIDKSDLHITEAAKKAGAAIVGEGVLLLLVRGSMLFKRIPMGITTREVAFNQDVKALDIEEGIVPRYLLYYLVSAENLLLGKVSATGIGAGKLDTSELKQLPVFITSSAEQERIIDCLASLDDLIIAQSKKIEVLKFHKKGLMRGLLPSLKDNE